MLIQQMLKSCVRKRNFMANFFNNNSKFLPDIQQMLMASSHTAFYPIFYELQSTLSHRSSDGRAQ